MPIRAELQVAIVVPAVLVFRPRQNSEAGWQRVEIVFAGEIVEVAGHDRLLAGKGVRGQLFTEAIISAPTG
jgi:hypothetical protein